MASSCCLSSLTSAQRFAARAGPTSCSGCAEAQSMPLLPAIPIRHRAVTAEVRSLGVGAVRCQRKLAPDPLRWIQRRLLTRSAPDEEKMTKRSPLDFPVEFDRNVGGARRADIFPQFSPFKPPLPQPSPGDPEEDDEDEEKEGDEENPDEDPEEKPEE